MNRAYINAYEFKNCDGKVYYGYTIFDDFESDYSTGSDHMLKDDRELLKYVLDNGGARSEDIIESARSNNVGISINGTWYEISDLDDIFTEWENRLDCDTCSDDSSTSSDKGSGDVKVELLDECDPMACNCGSRLTKYPLNDARGIFCTYVCDKCEDEERSKYRPEIFEDSNYEACETIEPEF